MEIGLKEILILAVVLLVLFGSSKIPELAKGIAESIRHVRDAFKGGAGDSRKA